MPKFTLGGKHFWTPVGMDVQEQLLDVVGDSLVIRTAEPERTAINGTQRYIMDYSGWSKGIGWRTQDRRSGRGVGAPRDSTWDTRFPVLQLGLLPEVETHAAPADHLVRYISWGNDLYGVFEENYASGSSTVMTPTLRVWNASTDTWDAAATIITEDEQTDNDKGGRVFDAITHKQNIFVLTNNIDLNNSEAEAGGARSYVLRLSSDASSFGDTAVLSTRRLITSAIHRRNLSTDDNGRLLDMTDTLMVALREDADSQDSGINKILIYYSTNSGTGWTAGAVILSGYGPKAFVRWRNPYSDPPGADIPVLVTAEGVYRVDVGGTTFELIYALDGNASNGRGAVVGQDNGLIIGLGEGGRVVLYVTEDGGLEARGSGDPGDGLVATRQGHVTAIAAPAMPWYFLAYGGSTASTKAGIFAVEYTWQNDPVTGRLFQPWHSISQHTAANQVIPALVFSSQNDQTPRLHYTVDGASASLAYHLTHPLDDESQTGIAHKRLASSTIEFARENFGDAHTAKNILRSRVDAEGLGTSDSTEYIEHEYGIDDAVATTVTNFGNFISTDKELFFGKTLQNITGSSEAGTPIGISAHSIRHLFTGNRTSGDSSLGPKVHEFEVIARNKINFLKRFLLPIDITLTALNRGTGGSAAQVLSDIETLQTTVPLLPFVWGDRGPYYVDISPPSGRLMLSPTGESGSDSGVETGIIQIMVEEVQ